MLEWGYHLIGPFYKDNMLLAQECHEMSIS